MRFLKTAQANQGSRFHHWMGTVTDVVVRVSKRVRGIFGSAPTSSEINSRWKVMTSFGALFWSAENRSRILGASALTGINILMNYFAPSLFGKAIDEIKKEESSQSEAMIMILWAIIAYTASPMIQSYRDQLLVPVAERNTKKLLDQITEHQLEKKALDYHTKTESGEQITLQNKGWVVANILTPLQTRVAPAVVEMLVASIMLYNRYGIVMPIGITTITAIFAKYTAAISKDLLDANENMCRVGGNASGTMIGAIKNYKPMHDFCRLSSTQQKIRQATSDAFDAGVKAGNTRLEIERVHIVISRGILLLSLYVGWCAKSRIYTSQDFLLAFNYLHSLSSSLPAVGRDLGNIWASSDAAFVFGELAKPSEIVDLHPGTPLIIDCSRPPSISFENVTFVYPGKEPLFRNLSLTIPSGQTWAIVGASGSGKSTLFQLLYRYRELTSGTIRIDGQDITKVSRKSLQTNISLFSQKPNLFNGTIRDNIKYGAPNPESVTDELIFSFMEMMNMTDFIHSFPKGLDTQVGEDGNALSGGQQQKVALLRGLLKGGRLCLFDEITSALDPESATKILDALRNALKNDVTSLTISHKLTETQNAHQIVVLEKGKVIDQGTHAELLRRCDTYKNLWYQKDSVKTENKQAERPTARALWTSMSKGLHTSHSLTAAAVKSAEEANTSLAKNFCLTTSDTK